MQSLNCEMTPKTLFSQAIDLSYHIDNEDEESLDYSNDSNCNIKDFDYILHKLKEPDFYQEDIDDVSTIGHFSDEDFHRNSSDWLIPQFTLSLSSDWRENLRALKEKELIIDHLNTKQHKNATKRRVTFDIPSLNI